MRMGRGVRLLGQAAALLPAGSFAVHQLRYHVAPSANAHHHGHGELSVILPVALVLLLGFVAHVLVAALRPAAAQRRRLPFAVLWAAAAVGLLAVYIGQEVVEGLIATGHPQGLTGALGNGGLWAVPLSVAVGAFCAAAVQQARRVEAAPPVLIVAAPRLRWRFALDVLLAVPASAELPGSPVPWRCSGRGPPLAVSIPR